MPKIAVTTEEEKKQMDDGWFMISTPRQAEQLQKLDEWDFLGLGYVFEY